MSFGVAAINRAPDGANWIMEFFDARTEWTFAEFVACLNALGATFGEVPDPPESGVVAYAAWKGAPLAAGYHDDYGCHLISPHRKTLDDLEPLIAAWTP